MTWFPSRFFHLAAVSPVSWFVLLRNIVLVALFVVVARPRLRIRATPAARDASTAVVFSYVVM